jgi:hypothetical protein
MTRATRPFERYPIDQKSGILTDTVGSVQQGCIDAHVPEKIIRYGLVTKQENFSQRPLKARLQAWLYE